MHLQIKATLSSNKRNITNPTSLILVKLPGKNPKPLPTQPPNPIKQECSLGKLPPPKEEAQLNFFLHNPRLIRTMGSRKNRNFKRPIIERSIRAEPIIDPRTGEASRQLYTMRGWQSDPELPRPSGAPHEHWNGARARSQQHHSAGDFRSHPPSTP